MRSASDRTTARTAPPGLSAALVAVLFAVACAGEESAGGGSAGAGGAGTDAGGDRGGSGGVAGSNLPRLLSETGLYSDIAAEALGSGVRAFEPRYLLWSDGSTKRRFVKLPAGESIDTSDMDFWVFPAGTQVWKEFTRDAVRVETRLLQKDGDGWEMVAYEWNADQTDAEAIPAGKKNAGGTPHDVPSTGDCAACHEKSGDVLIGISAVLLAHDGPGLTLSQLDAEGLLSNPAPASLELPGDAAAQAAMGYLHVNCGPCHNSTSPLFDTLPMDFWQRATKLGTPEETPVWQTTVGKRNPLAQLETIAPGQPDQSLVVDRMSRRGVQQMPPLGTELVDDDGVAAVRAWIASMASLDSGLADAADPDATTDGGGTD